MILITGATGYIGKHLLAKLSLQKRPIRCLSHQDLELSALYPDIETVLGDVKDEKTLLKALKGITTAYYLIHAMKSSDDYAKEDSGCCHAIC